jgi:twinkle protein
MLNAIDKGFKVLLVDGEYYQEELIRELYLKIIGNDRSLYDVRRPNKTDIKEPKRHILTLMQKWHKDKIYIISKNNCDCDFDNFENLFNVMVEAIQLYHIDLVILDNMASLVSSSQAERNSVQADFIKNVIQIDQKYNCHSLIVNHPKKQNERGAELDIFDMSGTSDMPNMMDNVFVVQRNFEPSDDKPDGWLHLKKNKLNGKHNKMPLVYNPESRTYEEVVNGRIMELQLNWRNNGEQEQFVTANDSPF